LPDWHWTLADLVAEHGADRDDLVVLRQVTSTGG